jgi:hypothetical protein
LFDTFITHFLSSEKEDLAHISLGTRTLHALHSTKTKCHYDKEIAGIERKGVQKGRSIPTRANALPAIERWGDNNHAVEAST